MQATWARGYWLRDLNQECFSGVHLALYVPIGVTSVLLFCLGPPLGLLGLMWSHRGDLKEQRTLQVGLLASCRAAVAEH